MRDSRVSLWAASAVVLLLGGLFLSALAPARAQAIKQYRIVPVSLSSASKVEEVINSQAQQGWELVQIQQQGTSNEGLVVLVK